MHHDIEIGSVEGIASEGQGIVRHDGRVTFIPFTAIGDTVRYQIDHHKKKYATATLLDVIDPSPNRVVPPCRYYGTCGGCQLQHVDYSTQLEYKRMWIENALRKIGGQADIVVPPVTPSNIEWSYRRRISLQLSPNEKGYRAGYITVDNKSLLEIDSCPIFTSDDDPILKELHSIAAKFHPACDESAKATILKCNNNKYLLHFHFKVMPKNGEEVCSNAVKNYDNLNGIVASSPKTTFSYGSIETNILIDKLNISFSPKTFVQNHPEQSLNIYRLVENYAAKIRPASTLDLYCGIGITSLLIARHGKHITGIEFNKQSVAFAKSNAQHNGIENATFIADMAEKALPSCLKKGKPDLIVINPPREGVAPDVLQLLCKSKARSLIYISCMPSTLARDLKALCEAGYKIQSITPFDMFPQTIHVETVIILEL